MINFEKETLQRLEYLEELNDKQKKLPKFSMPRRQMLTQIPRSSAELLFFLVKMAPEGRVIELGTSAGYSGVFIAKGLKNGQKLITHEIEPDKVEMAKETFSLCNISNRIDIMVGDQFEFLKDYSEISFCFLDSDNKNYKRVFDCVAPNFVQNGFLIADNIYSSENELLSFRTHVGSDDRFITIELPIGKGLLVARKI